MATRSGSKARNEVIEMLKEDHKRVKKAFSEFQRLDMDDEEDQERCQEIVQQVCAELEVHAAIEEEIFYPAARENMREPDLIDEAEVEHMTAKALIEQLRAGDLEPARQKAVFTVLAEYVKHHVREEENEIFEMLGRAKIDWEALQQEMQQRRMELMQEVGLEAEEGEEQEEGARGSRSRQRETETQE